MPKFLFNIEAEQLDRLRSLSQATGIPVAEFIRQGVSALLQSGTGWGSCLSGSVTSGHLLTSRG